MKKSSVLVCLCFFILCSCTKESKLDKVYKNFLDLNDNELSSKTVDSGYATFSDALNKTLKNNNFSIQLSNLSYSSGDKSILILDMDYVYKINNYLKDDFESIIETKDKLENTKSRIIYFKDNTTYTDDYKGKLRVETEEVIFYENFLFMGIDKNDIRSIQTLEKEQYKDIYISINTDYNNDFWHENSVGDIYKISDNRVDFLVRINNQGYIESVDTIYEFLNKNTKCIVESNAVFLSYDENRLDFPDDLETWPQY